MGGQISTKKKIQDQEIFEKEWWEKDDWNKWKQIQAEELKQLYQCYYTVKTMIHKWLRPK